MAHSISEYLKIIDRETIRQLHITDHKGFAPSGIKKSIKLSSNRLRSQGLHSLSRLKLKISRWHSRGRQSLRQ